MNLTLTGKTALVCGSTQGIGRAAAVELALLGATIVLIARNEETLRTTLADLDTSQRQTHRYLVADFGQSGAAITAVNQYLTQFPEVHILVNNTGGPPGGPLIDAKADEFVQTFHNHLLTNQALVQAVFPAMKKAGFGRIVNVISTSVKQPIAGLGVSNTIRGAVAQWAKTLSLEIARFGITVNNVLPGYTQTARLASVLTMRAKASGKSEDETAKQMEAEIPTGRFVTAEEVGAAIAFLCTPVAASINGINLPVDGGKTGSL
ncbi:SDR family oxidoreductase [Spirosoma radiotolerans]|uniref:Short-chain dehydrogenase n=1 Tax=Spirosoma radiotolerans TaxID=1379870 RepID=A0A0E3ZYU7_9BACT|nr:SDR family oxidoreductase [Spirosoma radiotolerans]AKD57669.1 short-chain dehydrogenase [Spirosoma radiotolerans]